MDDSDSFGDTAKLFEAINEEELKKLEETMEQMNGMFSDISGDFQMPEGFTDMSGVNMEDIPDPEKMQDHINGLLGGKLGRLATRLQKKLQTI